MSNSKLPRGVRIRGGSLIVTFALADGTIERRSLGAVSIKQAIAQRAVFQNQVREGTYQKAERKCAGARPKDAPTHVADLWPVYLQNYVNEGGRDSGRQQIAWNHLKPTFGSVRVNDVTTAMITNYIAARRGQGVQGGTINRELAILQAAFRLGTRFTGINGRPMVDRLPAFPSKLKEGEPRKGFITDPQYAVLMANAKEPWLRTFIECAYAFGFRKSELLNLRVGAVDLLERWIRLSGEDTKNGRPRIVKMTTKVYESLCKCVSGKNETDYVFTRVDGSRVVDPRDDWYTLCVTSKLGVYVKAKSKNGDDYDKYVGLTPHDFRRSAIRNMTRRGINDTTAMKISGHTTRHTFMRYNIVDEADLVDASTKIEAGRQVSASKTDTSEVTREAYGHS
jgi:integrase